MKYNVNDLVFDVDVVKGKKVVNMFRVTQISDKTGDFNIEYDLENIETGATCEGYVEDIDEVMYLLAEASEFKQLYKDELVVLRDRAEKLAEDIIVEEYEVQSA